MSQATQCIIVSTPVYGPVMNVITAITSTANAQVTTLNDHGYVDGTIVRFSIPSALGMIQIDQMTTPIVVTGDTTFTTLIDTTHFDTFAVPGSPDSHTNLCSLVIPIGELNGTLKAAERNIL